MKFKFLLVFVSIIAIMGLFSLKGQNKTTAPEVANATDESFITEEDFTDFDLDSNLELLQPDVDTDLGASTTLKDEDLEKELEALDNTMENTNPDDFSDDLDDLAQ
ncbi:MAG: hypothetical protein AAB443_01265 [Patescibacteria group bacterium]